jgi:hypothetical protein
MIKAQIMDHQHTGDSGFAAISFIFFILTIVGVGTVASIVAILSGAVSLFINYPKVKARVLQILKRKQ